MLGGDAALFGVIFAAGVLAQGLSSLLLVRKVLPGTVFSLQQNISIQIYVKGDDTRYEEETLVFFNDFNLSNKSYCH